MNNEQKKQLLSGRIITTDVRIAEALERIAAALEGESR